ncbi:MAG TPA: FUSC family protein, partial [Conexibacter sp.]|nr:FUSC family protein [Conexibacter sp.]
AHPQTLPSLGAAVQDLAVRLRRLVGASADHPATSHHAAQGIRVVVDALVDRPAAPTAVQRAELYLLNDVERLEGLVARLERSARPSDSDLDAVRGCADALGRCGELLSRGGSGGFDPDAGRAREPAARFGLVARLAAVTQAVERHAEAALGRASDARSRDAFGAGAPRGGWADLLHGARRFRANFTLRSVHVHDALRLGAGLALASAAVGVFGLQHGFWVAFATLTVIKSNLRATGRSVGEAIAGTLVGFALAAAVIAGLEPATGWYVALLPVVVAAAIYANVAVSFLAGQAGFTLVIIVLFNLLGPAGWRIGVVRLEDVAAGALAGLVIGAFAWPRGASATIGTAVGDLLEAAAGYLVVTARAYVGEPLPESRASRRQLAADASVRAESAFAQYLSEHPPPAGASGWAHWLSTGNRLWYAADLVADTRSGDVEPTGETVDAADRMLADCRALARSLRHDRVPPVNADGSSEPPRRRAGLADWLADLAADATARPAQATSRGRFGR